MISNNTSMPTTDDELQKNTVGELKPHNAPITLVEYDSSWPELFEQESNRIHSVLGSKALQIEHVGSTSIPGLCAKPIIDILLVVKDSADESSYIPALAAAGYVLQIREPDWFEHRLFKDRIPILICMCSVWAHQRLIECYASVIGCGLMILIGTNMHKSNEAWQRINGGMSSTMRMLKHQ